MPAPPPPSGKHCVRGFRPLDAVDRVAEARDRLDSGERIARRRERLRDSLHAAFEIGEAAVGLRIRADRQHLIRHLHGLVRVGIEDDQIIERAEVL